MFSLWVALYGVLAFGAYGAGDVAGRAARWAAMRSRWLFYACAVVLFAVWCAAFWQYAWEVGVGLFMLISIIFFSAGTADYRPRKT
jgi:hypothetical protein